MSGRFYVKKDKQLDFEKAKKKLQSAFPGMDTTENSREGVGCVFYADEHSSLGVHFFEEGGNFVVEVETLASCSDYMLAQSLLECLEKICERKTRDGEGKKIDIDKYFDDEHIDAMTQNDALSFMKTLDSTKGLVVVQGAKRKVYFGKSKRKEFSKFKNNVPKLAAQLEKFMLHTQFELPDYGEPKLAWIRPNDYQDGDEYPKVRMMTENGNWILQDYDYIKVGGESDDGEGIFIDNDDLLSILPDSWTLVDDFTVVAKELPADEWESFVEAARAKSHNGIFDSGAVSLASKFYDDGDEENESGEDDDKTSSQCHGDHWDCIIGKGEDRADEFSRILTASVQDSSLYGQNETDYDVDGARRGKVFSLEYTQNEGDDLCARCIVVATDDSNQVVSAYPLPKDGLRVSAKINEITEWEAGLEAWLEVELPGGRQLVFFDADYALNKEKYKAGESYDFVIGALVYSMAEPESKGFDFEGEQAVNFKAKTGEEPDYDENGNVMPIHFSTENLCAFMQFGGGAPDDAEFITTVKKMKTSAGFGKKFFKFDVLLKGEDCETEFAIPCFALKTKDKPELSKAKQVQGNLWLVGFMAR